MWKDFVGMYGVGTSSRERGIHTVRTLRTEGTCFSDVMNLFESQALSLPKQLRLWRCKVTTETMVQISSSLTQGKRKAFTVPCQS